MNTTDIASIKTIMNYIDMRVDALMSTREIAESERNEARVKELSVIISFLSREYRSLFNALIGCMTLDERIELRKSVCLS